MKDQDLETCFSEMLSAVSFVGRCAAPAITSSWAVRGVRVSHGFLNAASTRRQYSQASKQKDSSALTESQSAGGSEVSTATAFETVKETTKTAGNLGVILIGLGITGTILYAVFRELFSSNSPNNVYASALEQCKKDSRLQDHLGLPIKAYGEENSRGRRRHVSHSFYMKDGRKHMFLQFYIQGSRKKGTVYVEMREDDSENYQRNILVVELDDFARTKIILEDNTQANLKQNEPLPTLFS